LKVKLWWAANRVRGSPQAASWLKTRGRL
jgi:hypothetical protein